MSVLIKIHQAYREVVAVCDANLIGKKFEQDNKQLEITEAFFGGEETEEAQVIELIKEKLAENACFNFVGEKAMESGIAAGAIEKEGIMKIQGIPYALGLA